MARFDDEPRVFDVSKPHKVGPSATSKPVIVGHRPETTDPMVREDTLLSGHKPATSVPVHSDDNENDNWLTPSSHSFGGPAEAKDQPLPKEEDKTPDWHDPEPKYTPIQSLINDDDEKKDKWKEKPAEGFGGSDDGHSSMGTLPLSHPKGAGPRRGKKMVVWTLLLLLLAGAGAYLAIDAGAIGSGIKLPFEFFKEKEATVQPVIAPPPVAPPPAAPAVPAGFTQYKLEGTPISFAYPTAWGIPAPAKEEGFTKRGGANKSDGTYAYLVNFATQKDVQLVVSSSKYLPATRAATYYDFLQWCIGTNDAKFYKELLRFSTSAAKEDTPTTTTCDQGPLADATKLDETTILQAKTKDAAGKDIGDVYTQNLTDKEFTVLRVKDTPMTNGDNIKKLLTTVKVTKTPSVTQPQP